MSCNPPISASFCLGLRITDRNYKDTTHESLRLLNNYRSSHRTPTTAASATALPPTSSATTSSASPTPRTTWPPSPATSATTAHPSPGTKNNAATSAPASTPSTSTSTASTRADAAYILETFPIVQAPGQSPIQPLPHQSPNPRLHERPSSRRCGNYSSGIARSAMIDLETTSIHRRLFGRPTDAAI